jgi:hypothetical protein
MTNIRQFIKTDKHEYYNKVVKIILALEHITNTTIVVFGGFVRDIINDTYPRDVDIWFRYRRTITNEIFRAKFIEMITKLKSEFKVICDLEQVGEDGCYSVVIDSITFDFCCNTFNNRSFNELADFSVNNLYIQNDGQLNVRVPCEYTVEHTINHIRQYKLCYIINEEVVHTQSYWNGNTELYWRNVERKLEKMTSYGYN